MTDERRVALVNELVNLPAETGWVEFKSGNADPEMIGRTVSAISNSARLLDKAMGYVVWGVDDATHKVVGTNFEPSSKKKGNQPLDMWLARMLDPAPNIQFHGIDVDGVRVVLLEIPAATHAPVTFNRCPYVRLGSATPPLSEHRNKERALWAKLQTFAWEKGVALPFVSGERVLELVDHTSYFDLTGQRLPGTRAGILTHLASDGLIEADVGGRWNVLNLGAILFAKDLAQFPVALARKALRIVEYDGVDKIRSKARRDERSGYGNGFGEWLGFINAILPKNEHIGQAFREERRVYPEVAIRELVANALIHQDMTISGTGPVIEVFSDRLEITNPGVPLNDLDRLIDLPPRSRNEALAALMRRMRICEENGTGLKKAVTAIELFQSPPMDIRTEGDNTKTVLFAPRGFNDMTSAERVRAAFQHAILQNLSGARLTNLSLRKRLGIADQNMAQASRIIKQAMNDGLIRSADPESPRAGYVPYWAT